MNLRFPRRRSRIAEAKHGFMSKPRDWLLIGYAVTFIVEVPDGLLQLAHEVTLLSSIRDMPSLDLGRTPTVLIEGGSISLVPLGKCWNGTIKELGRNHFLPDASKFVFRYYPII
jgi:hypothetical protein